MAISGYLVIMPDYYRKTWCDPSDEKIGSFIKEKTDWKNLKEEWEQKIQPFAEEKGAQYYGSVGTNNICCNFFLYKVLKNILTRMYNFYNFQFKHSYPGTCWGSYMVLRLCENVDFKAGVSFHPSHSPISGLLGESEEEILKNVKCPQIFMPAEGDHENTYPGGLGRKLFINNFSKIIVNF